MFTSTDNGGTWGPVTLALPENTVSVLMGDGSSIYAGTTDGVLVSSDAGIHWNEITSGFNKSTVNTLHFVDGMLYAGSLTGVFASNTRGATWTRMNQGLGTQSVISLASTGNTLAAGTDGNGVFFRGRDDTSWNPGGLSGHITTMTTCGQTLLAGTWDSLFYSTDGGRTWPLSPGTSTGDNRYTYEGMTSSGGYAYATSNGNGVYVSADSGRHWKASNFGMKDLHTHACGAAGSVVYISSSVGVFYSTDQGADWYPCNNGLENHSVTALATTGGALLAGTADAGVYVSIDNGAHWRPANAGLPVLSIKSLVTDGQDVYAGTTSSGTCRRSLAELVLSLGIGDSPEPPSGFALGPNYPNPFNSSTRISYSLPKEGFVRLFVFDALGREIERLVDARMPAGTHSTEWRPSVASGVYFYRIEVSTAEGGGRPLAVTRKMIMLR
jgi:ligand-binding sensor domain-containing protein